MTRVPHLCKLLYNNNLAWMNTATALLQRVGGMGLDKYLFLMHLHESELVDLTPYYKSMLEAWEVFTVTRSPDLSARPWLLEEPFVF